MRTFYAALLWLTRFELAIARSTGRNLTDITQLIDDECRWELALIREEFKELS